MLPQALQKSVLHLVILLSSLGCAAQTPSLHYLDEAMGDARRDIMMRVTGDEGCLAAVGPVLPFVFNENLQFRLAAPPLLPETALGGVSCEKPNVVFVSINFAALADAEDWGWLLLHEAVHLSRCPKTNSEVTARAVVAICYE